MREPRTGPAAGSRVIEAGERVRSVARGGAAGAGPAKDPRGADGGGARDVMDGCNRSVLRKCVLHRAVSPDATDGRGVVWVALGARGR